MKETFGHGLRGEGEVQVGDRRERLQVGEWALIPAGEPLCYQLSEQWSEQLNETLNRIYSPGRG